MNPARRIVEIFSTHGIERQALSPNTALWPLVHPFDEAREDPCVCIGGPSRQEDRIGVPCDSGDGASDWLFQVF